MEGLLKKKVSIMRGFEDKWFKLTENGFLEYYEDTDVPANQIPSCVSGFGMKAGGLFDTSWYRRYFVLSDREFQFFLSETETTPQRTVPIEDIKGVANYSGYTGKQTVFQLLTKHKTFYIEVETQLELDKWTKELSYCLRKMEQIWLNPDLRVLKGKFYIGLARIAPDRDDCTFRIITNSGAKHILRSTQLTDRQKWIDTILETQKRVKKDMGPIVRKFRYKGAKHSAKESSSKEDKKDSSLARSDSVWFGGALGELAHHTMTVFDETEDTNTYSKQNCVLVAAIDFGSSDSGCAFSLRSDYESDPINNIHTESLGGNSSKTQKSPTVVLMNPDGEFAAFGKKAEQQYEELAFDDEDKKWFYFARFKMQLFTKKGLNKDMMLEDINGRKMKALDVFACCIEYIKNKVFKRAEEGVSNLQEDEVHWMITVPAIWNESARQFIIAAATKAGINPVLLSLVLEPEAAAVFCKYVAIRSSKDGKEAKLEVFESGSQFVIVDLGGGTVDITCNEVTETGQLQEIYHASGGPWGGNMINLRIWKLIRSIIGNATFDACMERSTYSKLCMLKEIEEGKMKMKSNEKATFKLAFEFSNKKIEYKGAEIIKDKIHIDPDVISKVFEYAIEQVCSHLSKVLARDETRNVKYLLLVGGYASCEILKETIKKKFNKYDIIHPCNNPEMIVLNGAVIMGHESRPIIGRLARYHYGLAVPSGLRIIPKKETTMHTEFDHELTFLPLICKGTPIRIGKEVAQYSFIVTSEELTDIEIGILTCEDDKAPSSIAENSCNKIGQIVAKFPALIKNSKMTIIISCDETEFKVTAVIDELGHSFSARCSFLL